MIAPSAFIGKPLGLAGVTEGTTARRGCAQLPKGHPRVNRYRCRQKGLRNRLESLWGGRWSIRANGREQIQGYRWGA